MDLQDRLRETEEKLKAATQELYELRRGLDESVIMSVSNLKGEITEVNSLMCKITGYSNDEIIGKNHRMFKSGHHPESFYKEMWETVVSGRVWKGEIMNRKKDGSFYWVDTTIVPFADANGRVYQFMSFRKDITFRKTAEARAERERAARAYIGRLAAVGETASNIAHEIRNPLGAILMRVELTRDQTHLTGELETAMNHIEKLARRIDKIIDSVRWLSRDGDGDPFECVNIFKLIRDTIEMINSKLKGADVSIYLDESDPDLFVSCRPVQISQVLVNLINNAIDAVCTQPKKWIRIALESSENKVRIFVSDSGDGIAQDIQDQIMRPFFTTKPVGKGTGLGLSVSREILRIHGGELSIDNSKPNTTFVVALPDGRGDAENCVFPAR